MQIIKTTDGITRRRIILISLYQAATLFALTVSVTSGNTLIAALNIATIFIGFHLLVPASATWTNRYDTSLADILGWLTPWAYGAAAVPFLVLVLKSPYDPAVLYWPSLAFALVFGTFSARERANHRTRDGQAAIRRAVEKTVPLEVAPDAPISMEVFDEAYEQARQRREAVSEAWFAVKLPTPRKLLLIKHGITADLALTPAVTALAEDDLETMTGLSSLAAEALAAA